MCRKGNHSQNGNFNQEKTVKCPRCNAKVPIKIGRDKATRWIKEVDCPNCLYAISFTVDGSGKVHLSPNGHGQKHAHTNTPKYIS